MGDSSINDVSDTAIWVAHFRAKETARTDALFRDELATKLVGARGSEIARLSPSHSKYVEFSVAIRTVIIDGFIDRLVKGDVDTVVNLGAGLDTRPYRLALPRSIKWVEADYPHLIEYKQRMLANDRVLVNLERVGLDLADRNRRQMFLNRIASTSKNVLILTEGVLPYLTEAQVGELADDLAAHPNFTYWIADYLSKDAYRFLTTKKRKHEMRNAPFVFFPDNWLRFFRERRWEASEIKYISEEALRLGRSMPKPWWAYLAMPLMSKKMKTRVRQMSGYAVFKRL